MQALMILHRGVGPMLGAIDHRLADLVSPRLTNCGMIRCFRAPTKKAVTWTAEGRTAQ